MAVQQTTGALLGLEQARALVARAGLRRRAVYDGWSRHHATGLSESLLVVAERPRLTTSNMHRGASRSA
jgi:hypothetical protein